MVSFFVKKSVCNSTNSMYCRNKMILFTYPYIQKQQHTSKSIWYVLSHDCVPVLGDSTMYVHIGIIKIEKFTYPNTQAKENIFDFTKKKNPKVHKNFEFCLKKNQTFGNNQISHTLPYQAKKMITKKL